MIDRIRAAFRLLLHRSADAARIDFDAHAIRFIRHDADGTAITMAIDPRA